MTAPKGERTGFQGMATVILKHLRTAPTNTVTHKPTPLPPLTPEQVQWEADFREARDAARDPIWGRSLRLDSDELAAWELRYEQANPRP